VIRTLALSLAVPLSVSFVASSIAAQGWVDRAPPLGITLSNAAHGVIGF
jgi:hypothetical protein